MTVPAARHHVLTRRHTAVWFALMVLTALTLLLYRAQLGALTTAAGLSIATAKALLVILFFMELWEHGGLNRLCLVVAVLFILILILASFADVAFRYGPAVPLRGASP